MRVSGVAIASALLLGQAPLSDTHADPCADYRLAPHVEGRCELDVPLMSLCTSGSFAFAASVDLEQERTDLFVIDAADPANPVRVGEVSFLGITWELVASESHVWAAIGSRGVIAIDVSEPASPRVAGGVATPGNAVGIAANGSYAYVADGDALQIVAIDNPASPYLRGRLPLPGAAGVAVWGDYAYVIDPDSGLRVVSVIDPDSPSLVGSLHELDFTRVAASADCAVIWCEHHLEIIDTADPMNPTLVAELWASQLMPRFYDLAIQDEYAYVASIECMQILDLSTLDAPEIVGSAFTHRSAFEHAVRVSGNHAYVACRSGNVDVIDVAHPEEPPVVGVAYIGEPIEMEVSGSYGYIAGYSGGLYVVDLTDVSDPTVVLRMQLWDYVNDLAISGDRAYVLDWAGLYIMDISDPPLPRILSFMPLDGVLDLEALGAHVFAGGSDASSGILHVIDVSDPRDPGLVAELTTAGPIENLTVSGHHLYAAEGESGLEVIDILDPAHPSAIACIGVPGPARDVDVSESHAFVVDDLGLRNFDITHPESPSLVGELDLPARALNVRISGNHAYVAGSDLSVALQVVDVANPAEPALLGGRCSPGGAWALTVADYVYCLEPGRLTIRPLQCELASEVSPPVRLRPALCAFPSPAREEVRVRFELPRPDRVQLSVFDSSGRLVRSLLDGSLGAGTQVVTWSGDDGQNRPVASGTYLIRLRSASGSLTTRAVMAR